MDKKKTRKKLEHLASDVGGWIEGIQRLPPVLADRAIKIGALSFFALFLGVYVGKQTDSVSLILWSAAISLFGFWSALRLLYCCEKGGYEVVEGIVYELKGRHSMSRVYTVGIRMEDGRETALLLDKQYRFKIGKKYRFYFNREKRNVLFGIRCLDAALNLNSFYGAEEVE